MKGYTKPILLILLVVLIDQLSKTWIKTNMFIGQEYKILGNWFIIHFTENNGMAFGMEFGGEFGKLALSLFRILAVAGIGYGLHYMIKHKYHRGLILNVALIFSGALGNIIDSVFYGRIYDYATLFHGRVVDMLYFPLMEGVFPKWVPIWGGEEYIFFRPVFNIADSAIFIGVVTILIFQKTYFKEEVTEEIGPNNELLED
ncbi:lipoprotein signal peptidase [Pedobacter antarcticus]|uniref:Lipoprotein signal peptidase n=2 Tax=Pedobacter antarcticus TaxID=34086 RepID=A0A081PK11_9SPHI|nr:lipoprotein signal peptidase [Pedobacter antarcticus]KEQ31034.1 peptidase A8 [Pedobacter antarcticus 4BY]SDM00229.1 signal peptidase II [Pedobacter antarcticus]SFF31780.1 signal peptidase II . Aspartic peptidase. MEROPS family A08 [Pedobacter antarcticus]